MVGDPAVEGAAIPFEEMVMEGSFQWDVTLSPDAAGTYYTRWYCSTSSMPEQGSEDLLWVSDLITFEVMSMGGDARTRSSSGGTTATFRLDPDGLPAIDKVGIQGDKAADLKAVVDAKYSTIAAVYRTYTSVLGRQPDAAGLKFWLAKVEGGLSLQKLGKQMAGQAEFKQGRGKLSAKKFIDEMYRSVLGRSADAEGRAFWLARLKSGNVRGEVAAQFGNSAENVDRLANAAYVVTAYYTLTGSIPSLSEIQEQAAKLDEGQFKVTVVEDIALTAKSAEEWMQAG
jgi:hypothetical protein